MTATKKQTDAALNQSIAHWERLTKGTSSTFEAATAKWCPLCRLFLHQPIACSGCPVKEETHHRGCKRTPYIKAFHAMNDYGKDSPQFTAAAAKELAFLKLVKKKRQSAAC